MKKAITIALICFTIMGFKSSSSLQANAQDMTEEIGLGDVIYDSQTPEDISHGFLMNEISYDMIRLHMKVAGMEIEENMY